MKSTTHPSIEINVPSETATLKQVVMCLANPVSISSLFRYGAFDIASIHQLLHNRWTFFYDYQKVCLQQQKLINVMQSHGVEVLLADNISSCISQHYIRDIGFAIDDVFFCANLRRSYRQREQQGLQQLLSSFSQVVQLEDGSIEGGDVLINEDYVIIGLGEETDREGIACLKKSLSKLGIKREIIVLEFSHRGVIHLDTKFNIVAPNIGLIYPNSFKSSSLRWLEQHFDLVEVTPSEVANVEINTLSLSPEKLVMLTRSQRLASVLQAKGLEIIQVDYSEVTKLPGSFRCTTLPIKRI